MLLAAIEDMKAGKLAPDYLRSRDFAQVAALAGVDADVARDVLGRGGSAPE